MNYKRPLFKKKRKKHTTMPYIEQLGQQVAGQATQAGMGLIIAGMQDKRQLRQQQKLQDMQVAGNMKLTDYNMQKQLEMWKATSYAAQIEQMKKANVNPALMYGIGGGGGGSSNVSTGQVSGGDAPKGGNESIALMGQGAQYALLAAQARNLDADTALKNAEAKNKPLQGANIQASTANLVQQTDNAKVQKEMMEIERNIGYIREHIAGMTQNMVISQISTEAAAAVERLRILENDKEISTQTKKDRIAIVAKELIKIGLENDLLKSQKSLTDQQRTALAAQIDQGWEKLGIDDFNSQTHRKQYELDKWVNDVAKSTELGVESVKSIIQAVIFGGLMRSPGAPTPIRGFHKR